MKVAGGPASFKPIEIIAFLLFKLSYLVLRFKDFFLSFMKRKKTSEIIIKKHTKRAWIKVLYEIDHFYYRFLFNI